MPTIVRVKKLHPEARIPKTWSDIAVGFDLHALLLTEDGRPNNALILSHTTRSIRIGIAIECPSGTYADVRPRSGLAKHSVTVANAPGTIDPDYRGEVIVLLHNGGRDPYYVQHGDRIAQMVIRPYITDVEFVECNALSETQRGEAGFGSTGT